MSNGDATISATLDASMASATLHVAPSGAHLVINEVEYDEIGTDTGEFVEVYNPTASSINLSNIALVLVNGGTGGTGTEYERTSLATAGSLTAGHYLVVADGGVNVAPSSAVIHFGTAQDSIRNGGTNGDGVALVDTSSSTLLDALSYEGSITMATITGFPSTVSLVEGTATPAVDSNSVAGSLVRTPNGSDTDDAQTDWQHVADSTPGSNDSDPPVSNAPPTLNPVGNRTVAEGHTLSFTLSASDPDSGSALTYSASHLPSGASFNPSTRVFSWTPSFSQAGSYPNVHFSVSDGSSSDSEDITIAVTDVAQGGPSGNGTLTPPAGGAATTAVRPNTKLKKHPKKRVVTKGHKAKVTFRFGATQKGSTFKCKIDKKRFARCHSPKSYKLKPGKHTFKVEAIDSAGADRTPARYSFRVVRKR